MSADQCPDFVKKRELLAPGEWAESLDPQGLQSDDQNFCPRFATVTILCSAGEPHEHL